VFPLRSAVKTTIDILSAAGRRNAMFFQCEDYPMRIILRVDI